MQKDSVQRSKQIDTVNLAFCDNIFIEHNVGNLSHLIKKFQKLERNDLPFVPVMIESNGGSVEKFLAIYHMIKSSPKPVLTFSMGTASSSAAHLLAAGTPGLRLIASTTNCYIHYATTGDKENLKVTKMLLSLLDKDTGEQKGSWFKLISKLPKRELYLWGHDIIKFHLADRESEFIVKIEGNNVYV